MGNSQGASQSTKASSSKNNVAANVAANVAMPDDDADDDAIADMAWGHVSGEQRVEEVGVKRKPGRPPGWRSKDRAGGARESKSTKEAGEMTRQARSDKRRKLEEEENREEEEDDAMLACMAWEALGGTDSPGARSSTWERTSSECKGCRGLHRPHTCGKHGQSSTPAGECKACRGLHRPHTCGRAQAAPLKEARETRTNSRSPADTDHQKAGKGGQKGGKGREEVAADDRGARGGGKREGGFEAMATVGSKKTAESRRSGGREGRGRRRVKDEGRATGDDDEEDDAAVAEMALMMMEEEEEEGCEAGRRGRIPESSRCKGKVAGGRGNAGCRSERTAKEEGGRAAATKAQMKMPSKKAALARRDVEEEEEEVEEEEDQGDRWSEWALDLLMEAYRGVRPDSVDFWGEVAGGVPGKTAQECCDRYHAYFPTPGAIKGRGKGGRKRPESPRQSEEAGEDAALGAAVLLAKKGTNARRKEYRHVMARADNGHTDDVFEGATAVSETPLRGTSALARLMTSHTFAGAPSPLSTGMGTPTIARSRHMGERGSFGGFSPGILNTPGLEGRDRLDNYIDNTKKRSRTRIIPASLKVPVAPAPAKPKVNAGAERAIRALKRIMRGQAEDGEDDEDEDEDDECDREGSYDEDGDLLASPS